MTTAVDIAGAIAWAPMFAAVLLRVGAMFLFAPLFGSGRIPRRIKAMLAIVLSVSVTLTLAGQGGISPRWPGSLPELALAAGGEMAFGLAMGMVVSLVFVAVQWAGEVVGQQLGFTLGAVFDPQYGGAGSVVSDLYFMLSLVIFLGLRGHHAMIHGLVDSFGALPPLTATVTPELLDALLGGMQGATVLALRVAAPVLAATLITDVALGFVGKTLPQFNVLQSALSLKSLLGMGVMAMGIVLTSEVMTGAFAEAIDLSRRAWVGAT